MQRNIVAQESSGHCDKKVMLKLIINKTNIKINNKRLS